MQIELRYAQIPSNVGLLLKAFLKKAKGAPLPAAKVVVADFRLDAKQLASYNSYCGFAAEAMPLSFPFVATQPLQLMLLCQPQVPVTPLGMIHLGVAFEQFKPFALNRSYRFELSVGEQVHNERGLEFELVGEFFDDSADDAALVSRYQSRCFIKIPGPKSDTRPARERRVNRDWQMLAPLQLDAAQARGYARLSGDFNPIHLHRWLSKPFGFNEPIAHGMYMVAKVLAAAPQDLTQAAFEFKRPALLPISGEVEHSDGALRFVNDKRKPLLECVCG
ncbi:MaoC/PaaZ C-terminal domain-containing protein [Ferrimonas senticii]|uniref:MaoC/PaaZ C-terminal domain-containing protein n=1 Tax=Ferrimonas senticii TaxID=394566 RepID=UPI00040B1201|nr:MaoC/PaaZ C-terminal domain-containing protein [Ferrimonas senticii]